jgi:hypothetical protein
MQCTTLIATAIAASLSLAAASRPAAAWWDEGHMQIAYAAYKKLDPAVREKADALLKLNPDYSKWTASVPDALLKLDEDYKKWTEGMSDDKLFAFMHAATWADDIKAQDGYKSDDASGPAAGEITGYGDHFRHAYWHFKDIPFSPEGVPSKPDAGSVDAVSQLKRMIDILPGSSGKTTDVRSYALVWILHLVGDLHQPLHAVTRLTRPLPGGDSGGNAETVIPATGETIALHFYWDRMFGGFSSAYGAVYDAAQTGGLVNLTGQVNKLAAEISDPQVWAEESAVLAKEYAYAPPVPSGANPVYLTRTYETNARNIARSQAALAAVRLARLLNAALKDR